MQNQVRMDADVRPSAYAKAKVITQLAQVAAARRMTTTAQLLVQYLLAIADPHKDGWVCRIANNTLSERLDRHEGTIRRLLTEVGQALPGIVRRTPGQPGWDQNGHSLSSEYVFDVRCLEECAGAPLHLRAPRERASAQNRPLYGRASAPHSSNSEFQQQQSEPAAAAAGVMLSPQEEESRVRVLTKRPEWLPEGKPWLEATTALQLVRMAPWATTADVLPLEKEVRASRLTVEKPAGLFISLWRRMAQEKNPCRA